MIILNLTSFNLLACLLLHRVLVLCYEISDVNTKSQLKPRSNLNSALLWCNSCWFRTPAVRDLYDWSHFFLFPLYQEWRKFHNCVKKTKKGNICLLLKPFCQAETCRCETTIHLMQGFHLKQVVFNSTKWVDFQTLIEGHWIIISFQISLTQEDSTKFSHQIPHSIDLKWNIV